MSPNFLIDTNVLVYSIDQRAAAKQAAASRLLRHLASRQEGALSAQCLTEYGRVLQRAPLQLSYEQIEEDIAAFIRAFTVFPLGSQAVQAGLRGRTSHQLAYWDSFIWAVAKLNDVPYILTEDGQHGRVVEGVTYLNPFVSGFVLPAAT